MSSSGPDQRLDNALAYFDTSQDYGDVGGNLVRVLSGFVLFVGTALVAIGEAVTNFFVGGIIDPISASVAELIFGWLRAPGRYMQQLWNQAADALNLPMWAAIGPFQPIIGTIVVLAVLWMFAEFLDRRDSDIPGTGLDVPFLGNDSDGEED